MSSGALTASRQPVLGATRSIRRLWMRKQRLHVANGNRRGLLPGRRELGAPGRIAWSGTNGNEPFAGLALRWSAEHFLYALDNVGNQNRGFRDQPDRTAR